MFAVFGGIQELILPVYGSLSFELSEKFSLRTKTAAQGRSDGSATLAMLHQEQTVSKVHEVQAASDKAVPHNTAADKPGPDPACKAERLIFPEQVHTNGNNSGPRKSV